MTTGAFARRSRPSAATSCAIVLGTVAVLAVLAPRVFQPHAFASIDTAIKLIQSTELSRSGFRSMALSYPAHTLDPAERFLPFESPFVFLSAGKWQSIFSSFYALIAAPLVPFGVHWLVGLAVLGVVAAVISTSWLPGAHSLAGPLALMATPIWLYGLNPNETPLALGCAVAALAVASRVGGARGDWTSGLLLGLATLLRDESLLVAPGLLYARHLAGTPVRQLPRTAIAIATPIVVMAAVDHWWFDRPMLAHLRHAVPGFDALLPRSRARLPELRVMRWHERTSTIVEYWLLGFGSLATGALLAVWIGLAHAVRRTAPVLVATLAITAAVLHVLDLAALIPAPRVLAGLFRLAPFLVLALLPRAQGEPAPPLVRLVWVTCALYMGAVFLSLNTAGGKPNGPRLMIALWPLLAAASVETLASYLAAARSLWTARLTAGAGLVLVAGSLVMELGVVLPARAGRNTEDAEVSRFVRAIGDDVIVMDTVFDIEIVGTLYFDRKLVHAQPRHWRELSQALADHGVRQFTHIARPPTDTPVFPQYRRADAWAPGRFIISRWVLETSASP